MRFRMKTVIAVIVVVIVVAFGWMSWHQHNHFNRNVTINGVNVGGKTADQALATVKEHNHQANKVYLDGKLIYDGPDTEATITNQDRSKFVKALAQQRTIFPTGKAKRLQINPDQQDQARLAQIKSSVTSAVDKENQGRRAPHDAYALLKNDKVTIVSAKSGTKIDQQRIARELSQQRNNSVIRLTSHHRQPLSANSATVQHEKTQLKKLLNRHVTYQVEQKQYHFDTDDVITSATYQHGHYQFNTRAVNKRIADINRRQATLGRKFKFKTHSGQVIETSQAGTYGWKISEERAGQSLANAIADGTKKVEAKQDIYGIGYNKRGTGYGVISNDGIGETYAELSIADQHAWFYKDGKCVFDADVVTGKNSRKEDQTPLGVWYIMYQASPSVLKGTDDSGSKYSSKVQFWSQFTNSGCGFHDASWRHNWSKTAYLNDGSSGCANMHPADAGAAYRALQVNEPVVVY